MILLADKSIQFLLLIDALRNTNRENPKTSKQLMQDVELAWTEIFPDEKPATLSPATIGRHIKAMNKSGLYHIQTCKNAKDGYYCDQFLFDSAEFCIIAQALFRSVSLSTKETKVIMEKFLCQTDDLGESFLNTTMQQLQRTAPRRKIQTETLPIFEKIMYAIWKQKQIFFTYNEQEDKQPRTLEEIRQETDFDANHNVYSYYVSPYYLIWEADECYLIANITSKINMQKYNLSHFKISLISSDLSVSNYPTISISKMKEYRRYSMRRTIPEQEAIWERKKLITDKNKLNDLDRRMALIKFSLDRYMRENLFMIHDDSRLVDIKLHFRENFLSTIMNKFNLDRNTIKVYQTEQHFSDGASVFSAVITVQENDGLYMWLMQHGKNVIVADPQSVRENLKKRYVAALEAIREYEDGAGDPIDE